MDSQNLNEVKADELSEEALDGIAGGKERHKARSRTRYTVCWTAMGDDGEPYYTEDVFYDEEKAKAFMAIHGGKIERRHWFG